VAGARDMITRALRTGEGRKLKAYGKRAEAIAAIEPEMELLGDGELHGEANSLRERARDGEALDDLLPEAFALVREASRRTLGQRHYDVQLIGGMALHDGAIAEMKTGEGKTLTATLAVFLNTLAGDSVHVVTVNDYLARRDAEWMKPIYDALGVTVAAIQDGEDHDVRKPKYACDVVYGTNSEFGFDYLHDNMADALEECVQRDRTFAIVDEIDSILIDAARTPLIIAGEPEETEQLYSQFARLAREMKGVPGKLDPLASPDTSKADYDYEFDEKHRRVAPTERGVKRAEEFLGVENLYMSEHGGLVNDLMQALAAESLYKRDRDYVVIDEEVVIVDRFTGRVLEDQRWGEGLHQAVEAKEGLAVQEQDQTIATITLQNYFRLYGKLAGMTGTALTEAREFMKIYKTPVVEIPTNRPMVRIDHEDRLFATQDEKWQAVLGDVVARHEKGQPILMGTASVETSEMISAQLTKRGIEHAVLNAKPEHAQREGETIAQAGRKGAVMIATNMAGRGVDIKLGGDAEQLAIHELEREGVAPGSEGYEDALAAKTAELEPQCEAEAEEVREIGGLYICGTERHESRRIDNQLRGRSGRQGDPGETRFFTSTEDEVVRLHAGDRISSMLEEYEMEEYEVGDDGVEDYEVDDDDLLEEMPLEDDALTRTVEGAQKKVEEENFLARKYILSFDNVLSKQRNVIYRYRRKILEGRDISEVARDEVEGVIERLVDQYTPGDELAEWDMRELEVQLRQIWPLETEVASLSPAEVDRERLKDQLDDDMMRAYDDMEALHGKDTMRHLERAVLLDVITERWREHLRDMDYLQEGIFLRGWADISPLVAYKIEGHAMFQNLMHAIWEEFSRIVFHVDRPAELLSGDSPASGQGGDG
jgi:preprotein translocase subunit SecA